MGGEGGWSEKWEMVEWCDEMRSICFNSIFQAYLYSTLSDKIKWRGRDILKLLFFIFVRNLK